MYWRNHFRILFTVALVWQAVRLGNGHEKEEREEVKSLNVTAQKQQPKNEGTAINALSDMNQSYESRKQQNSRASVPFTGITESKKLNRHCCQNGGTCILGAFCACLKHFTGRYCEHDERQSNCGSIAHGAWVMKGCWLCRCGYGNLNCLSEIMHGNCGKEWCKPNHFYLAGDRNGVCKELKSEKEKITSLHSNGLKLQQTVFALACLLMVLLELCC